MDEKWYIPTRRDCGWVIFILLVTVIVLLSTLFAGKPQTFGVISCAVTLASLVLSMIAIFFSLIQGNRHARFSQDAENLIATMRSLQAEINSEHLKNVQLADMMRKMIAEETQEPDKKSSFIAE